VLAGIALLAGLWRLRVRRHAPKAASSEEIIKPVTKAAPPSLSLGVKAFMAGDYLRAEPVLRYHAEAGSLKAQQLMAKMYYGGHGVERNLESYGLWLQKAADQGDKSAKARLKALHRRD